MRFFPGEDEGASNRRVDGSGENGSFSDSTVRSSGTTDHTQQQAVVGVRVAPLGIVVDDIREQAGHGRRN